MRTKSPCRRYGCNIPDPRRQPPGTKWACLRCGTKYRLRGNPQEHNGEGWWQSTRPTVARRWLVVALVGLGITVLGFVPGLFFRDIDMMANFGLAGTSVIVLGMIMAIRYLIRR